ncbi:MAG: hypothetical protein ACPK85_13240 [Methanosarcina sp.]
MRVKQVTSIMRIMGILIIVSMIPSCVSASENNPPAQMSDMRFGSSGNITEENFAEIQTSILDFINEQITELQNFHTNVSEASDAIELKEALASHRPAHAFMRHARMDMGLCQKWI